MILRSLGIPESEMQVAEKVELVRLLQKASKEREEKQRAKERLDREEEENERIRRQICHEVDRWKRNRSIRWLLNNINRASVGSPLYLPPYASFAVVSKVYKRALLKIHPDKHADRSLQERWRAEETFKAVNECFTQFRKLHGNR